ASRGPRRDCAHATDHDDRPDRERDADTESDDDGIRLGVAAGLERLIPTIEQLRDRCAETDGQNGSDGESSHHVSECNTRVSSVLLSFARCTLNDESASWQ